MGGVFFTCCACFVDRRLISTFHRMVFQGTSMRLFDKTVNVRLLAILLLIGVVLGCGIHWLHGFQARRQAGFFFDLADEAIEEGRVAEALRHLDRYIELRPDDVDALEKLGLLQIDCGLLGRAYSTLEKTLRKAPDRTAVRRKLIDLAIMSGRFSDAKQHISPQLFPQSYKDNELQDAELLVILAACQVALEGDNRGNAAAKSSLERAIELEPDRLGTYQRLAMLLRRKFDDPAEADGVMDEMVERNQRSAESLVARAGYWFGLPRFEAARLERSEAEQLKRKWFEAARDDACDALESASQDSDVPWISGALWIAAKSSQRLGQLEAARTHALRGIEVRPRQAAMYNLLAEIELLLGKPREAIEVMKRGLAQNPNDPDLLWNRATVSIHLGDVDQAQQTVEKLGRIDNLPHPIELPQGQLACLKGEWRKGRDLLETVRVKVLDKPDLAKRTEYWLAKCYGRLGKPAEQLAAYRKAISIDPKWVSPRLAKARLLRATGQLDGAIAEYGNLSQIEGHARIELARLMVMKNVSAEPSSRNWQEVTQVLDQLPEEEQGTVDVLMLRVECLSQRGEFEAAERSLAAAEKERPENVEIRCVRAVLLQKQGKWTHVEELFDKAKHDLGNSAALQRGLAVLIERQFGKDGADRLRDLAGETEGLSEPEKVEVWRDLMALSYRVGDLEQVERLYHLASQKDPRNAAIQRRMFEVALSKKDREMMGGVLKMIAEIEGQEAFWHYGEAVRQRLLAGEESQAEPARKKHLENALEHLAKAETLRPSRADLARIHLLTGDIRYAENRYAEALDSYQAASRLGMITVAAVQRAVSLLNQRGRYEEADQLMARVDKPGIPLTTELRRSLAESLLRAADDTRALEEAEKVAASSEDYRDHLWLAQFGRLSAFRAESEDQRREMLGKAEQSYRKAVDLSADSPAAWVSRVALVRFLKETGQTKAVPNARAELQENLPTEGGPYELAVCYVALGKPDKTRVELAKIIDSKQAFSPGQVTWARRQLASILLMQSTYGSLQHAEELLRKNLDSEAESVLDKRALATVLSVSPDPGKRLEAVSLLEELVESEANPQDRFSLAKLYLARGDWAEASGMFSLVAAESDRPGYTATYVAALLDRGQVSDAASWLKRLNELAPGEFPTVSLQAQVFCRLGQVDEAIALVEGIQETAEPAELLAACTNVYHGSTVTPPQAERIESVVEAALEKQTPTARTLLILTDLRIAQERFDDVEALYRQILSANGESVIALNNLAVILALRKKNLDEAVRMIDRAIELGGPSGTLLDSRATVYLANGRASEALDGMRKAIAENAKPSRYFHLAQVQDGLGNPREAKKALAEARELGLRPGMLHPLERAEYDRLSKVLDR
jgi:tetratricopeptide (TPR) repeat protein